MLTTTTGKVCAVRVNPDLGASHRKPCDCAVSYVECQQELYRTSAKIKTVKVQKCSAYDLISLELYR